MPRGPHVDVDFSPTEMAWIAHLAKREDRSRNAWIRHVVRQALLEAQKEKRPAVRPASQVVPSAPGRSLPQNSKTTKPNSAAITSSSDDEGLTAPD